MRKYSHSFFAGMWIAALGFYACTDGNFAANTGKVGAALSDGKHAGTDANDGGDSSSPKTLYVPLGAARALPTTGSTGECTSDDVKIASCKSGSVTGNKLGQTVVHAGGEDIPVIVYDPNNPPPGLDSGGGSGGGSDVADGNDTSGGNDTGIKTGNDSTGAGDAGITDGGENTTSLLEPMTVTQLKEGDDDADCANDLTLVRLDENGAKGTPKTVHFDEGKAKTVSFPDFCSKKGDTIVKMAVKFKGCGDRTMTAGDSKYVAKTATPGPNIVEFTVDDGNCLLGNCIDRGSDNTFHLECPHNNLSVDGLP